MMFVVTFRRIEDRVQGVLVYDEQDDAIFKATFVAQSLSEVCLVSISKTRIVVLGIWKYHRDRKSVV